MLKFAICTTSVRHEGGVIRIQVGDVWHATDPFVRSHPELFADEPVRVFGTPARRVESATAAPGETRGTKRSAG